MQNLDFDFEKCCSVSLSPVNVYACLVCGKYFQGRGPQTHAYTHALEVGHQMYMKLDTGKVRHGYEEVRQRWVKPTSNSMHARPDICRKLPQNVIGSRAGLLPA